jgi:hypothetical protein
MTNLESRDLETRARHVVDRAAECPHMTLRPQPESDGYVCEGCHRELSALEAQEACSEASARTLGGQG